MAEEYYKALGVYTHHLNEALKKGEKYRSVAMSIRHIAERIISANYPYSEYHLPPQINNNELSNLSKELTTLNEEIEQHIKEANIYAKDANKEELKRKDF